MLSHLNFIAKRKTKLPKAKPVIRHIQSTDDTPPFTFQTSHIDIIDINEKASPQAKELPLEKVPENDIIVSDNEESQRAASPDQLSTRKSSSPRVDVVISDEPLNDWFPEHLLNSGGWGESNAKANVSPDLLDVPSFHEQTLSSKDKRGPPSPIKIPNNALHGPKVQLQRQPSFTISSRPESTISLDNMSSISGTTLARALLSNSFIFPLETSRRSSRYRSGAALARQDSATLPRGDHPLLNSPYWRDRSSTEVKSADLRDAEIPPVPPVPSESELELIMQMKAEERNALSNNYSFASHRISHISERSSPDSTDVSNSPIPRGSINNYSGSSLVSTTPGSVPTSASLYPSTPEFSPPISSATTPSSSREIDNVLDYYQFVAAGDFNFLDVPRHAVSPILEETSSMESSPSPYGKPKHGRNMSNSSKDQSEWVSTPTKTSIQHPPNPKPRNGLLPIGEISPSPQQSLGNSSSSTLASVSSDSAASLPPFRRILGNRSRSGSAPTPITVVRDPRDLRTYNITVSPIEEPISAAASDSTHSAHEPSNTAQTFPETPRAFSPLFSAGVDTNGSRTSLAEACLSVAPRRSGSLTSLCSVAARLAPPASRLTPPPEEVPAQRPTPPRNEPILRTSEFGSVDSEPINGSDVLVSLLAADTESTSLLLSPKSLSPNLQPATKQSTIVETDAEALLASQLSLLPPSVSTSSTGSSYSATSPTPPSDQVQTSLSSGTSAPGIVRHSSASNAIPSNLPPVSTLHRSHSHQQPHPLPSIPHASTIRQVANTPSFVPSASTSIPAYLSNSDHHDSFNAQYGAPPPYDAVFETPHMISRPITPARLEQSSAIMSRSGSEDAANRRLTRSRPPLPAGPRRPSVQYGGIGRRAEHTRQRNGSISSVASVSPPQRVFSSSSPQFRLPVPKWRGFTMDAAKWTFSSSELQGLVSQAIRQSSQASCIRLLQPDVFNNELPEELYRLQAERSDLTTRYKILVRKRAALLSSLSSHIEGLGEGGECAGMRIIDEVNNVSANLDQISEELLNNAEQTTQLTSLRDIHSYSALAMALRKLNTSFVNQVAANQALREQVITLEAEKEEAWKQAEEVAHDFDHLKEQVPERSLPESMKSSTRRSSSVSKRKSRVGAEVCLRSSSALRSHRSSYASNRASTSTMQSGARSVFGADDTIPPVPTMPTRRPLGIITAAYSRESVFTSSDASTFENSAMIRAQQELYAMLGLPMEDRRRPRTRSRSVVAIPQSDGSSSPSSPLAVLDFEPQYARPTRKRPSSLPSSAGIRDLQKAVVSENRQAILTTLGIM